jgi:hypothetical protein
MQHRGIEYDIKIGVGPNVWVWTARTSKPKRGQAFSRATAIVAAVKAIDQWCRNNPAECAPATAA